MDKAIQLSSVEIKITITIIANNKLLIREIFPQDNPSQYYSYYGQ